MDQRLKDAAQAGDIHGLYRLIQEDAIVFEAVQQVGDIRQRLREAAQAGDTDGFYHLIRENGKVVEAAQVRDIGQRLKQAAQAGDIDALYALIREDARVLERIDEMPLVDTPLHVAASAGHIDFAMEIVNLKASFVRKLNPDGFSPMHLALQNDHMLMVTWLIDVDGNLVRVKGKGGFTPLHYAAEQGKLSILLECFYGCPESIKDVTFQGDTALHIAVKNHQKEAFELLMEWLRWSSFEDAGFWEMELINWKNKEGKTVLHVAASETGWNDQYQVLKLLLRCHAKTGVKDLAGLTAMEILRDQVRLTERQIWNMQAAGAGFSFPLRLLYKRVISPLILLYKSVISPRHSVRQEAQTWKSKSRPLLLKLWQRRNWKSSEKRNTELVVDTLIVTAIFQTSLSPPGGLWQGTATADINAPILISNSSTTSGATYPHFTGTSVLSPTDFLIFFYGNMGLFLLTALRMTVHLFHDISGPSFSFLSVNWLIFSYIFSLTVIIPNKEIVSYRIARIVFYCTAVFMLALLAKSFVKYISSVPREPRVKLRRRRVTIRDRKEWW